MIAESADFLKILQQKFPQIAERALQNEIAEVSKLFHFKSGEVIMNFGSYVKLVPLVVSGSIKVTREDDEEGRELLLYFLGEGETCAMSFTCCMMHKKSDIRTEAVEDTVIIGIPIHYVDAWMGKYQSWKNFVMTTYDDKMKEMVRTIDSIAFKGLDDRLVKYLDERAKLAGSPIISITHQEIAADLNVSREAVSRLLKKLENLGQVELGRNQIKIIG